MMLQGGRSYPSTLSKQQWDLIKDLVPRARSGGRKRTTDVRAVVNAIFYVNRSGCAWRYLPSEFPPWKTVYDYFNTWRAQGVWKRIHDSICTIVRANEGKKPSTRLLIIDSQSVKATHGSNRGYDGFKRIRGRKRHILVDTLGLIHAVKIDGAQFHDGIEGSSVVDRCKEKQQSTLKAIYADQGYRGTFVEKIYSKFRFKPTLPVPRKNSGQGKPKLNKDKKRKLRGLSKKRWIVERTFSWFNHYRRLTKDYEKKVVNSEAMIHLAMSQLMLRRLTLCSISL